MTESTSSSRSSTPGRADHPVARRNPDAGVAQLIDLAERQSSKRRVAAGAPGPVSAQDDTLGETRPSAKAKPRARWLGPAILVVALGVLGQAWAGYEGRTTGTSSSLLWYATLCMIFSPSVALVMSRQISDTARIWFTLYMSLALLATRFVLYPSQFAYHDELINYRVLLSINHSGHLFTPNSLLPAVADYPGMQIATATVHQITGLPLHSAGMIILFAVRLVMTLALIRIIQRITNNAALGCLAALIYVTNPQYIFFNSQFSYQSVALPLSLFCIYVFSIRRNNGSILSLAPTAAVLLAVAATHHLTSLALVILFWAWYLFTRITRRPVSQLLPLAIIGLVILAGWTWLARSVVIPYISEILRNSLANVAQFASGKSNHRMFTDSAGDHNPIWQAVLSIASVLLIISTLIPALWLALIKRRMLSAGAMVLFSIAAIYPLIPAGHLTNATAEVSDRASGFVFVGLGYLVGIWWFRDVPFHRHARTSRFTIARHTWVLVIGLTICFVGGTIIGSGPDWLHGPGAYLVSADNRSVDRLAVQAASWEGQHLPANSRIYSDRVNDLLAAVYGDQHPVTSLGDGINEGSVSTVLLQTATPADASVACQAHLNFLIADQRLATSLPHVGMYVDKGEYLWGMRTAPPDPSALTKFDAVPGAQRIFDNGAIRIYDLRGLLCAGGK